MIGPPTIALESDWSRKWSYTGGDNQIDHISSDLGRESIVHKMQPFMYFTTFFGVTEFLLKEEESRRKQKRRDHLGNLPPELASSIFRYLDED